MMKGNPTNVEFKPKFAYLEKMFKFFILHICVIV